MSSISSVETRTTRYNTRQSSELPTLTRSFDVEPSFKNLVRSRALSPTITRLENKVNEIQDEVELEQQARIRAEKQLAEVIQTLEMTRLELDECHLINRQNCEGLKKRDMEITFLRDSLTQSNNIAEDLESGMEKKYKAVVTDFSAEIENLSRQKGKAEKDKQSLLIEINNTYTQLEDALKAKSGAEIKLEELINQVRHLRNLTDSLQSQVQDLNGLRNRLLPENEALKSSLRELEQKLSTSIHAEKNLNVKLMDIQRAYEDERNINANIQNQLTNLEHEIELLQTKLQEETLLSEDWRNRFNKLNGELPMLKSKLERELEMKQLELDEMRKKLNFRLHEAEAEADRERTRAQNLERLKAKLTLEIDTLSIEINKISEEYEILKENLNGAESEITKLNLANNELAAEIRRLNDLIAGYLNELSRLKNLNNELSTKLDNSEKENRRLVDQNRDLKLANKDLNLRLVEMSDLRAQLEAERDNLAGALHDAEDSLKDLDRKFQASQAALSVLKSEMEARIREKDDELENFRKLSQKSIDELTSAINDMEVKFKQELTRVKKRFELALTELEDANKNLDKIRLDQAHHINDQEITIKRMDEEIVNQQNEYNTLLASYQVIERKRSQMMQEVDLLTSRLEASERAKRNAENEAADIASLNSDLNQRINALQNEKRGLENIISQLNTDLDEAVRARKEEEEKSNQLRNENDALKDELEEMHNTHQKFETIRRTYESEIRECSVRITEAETRIRKESNKEVVKLQNIIRNLENECDLQNKTNSETTANLRKLERLHSDLQKQSEEDRKLIMELQQLLEKTQAKMKLYKRQLEDAEEQTAQAVDKCRRVQKQLEETELHIVPQLRSNQQIIVRGSSVSGGVLPTSGSTSHRTIASSTFTQRATSLR